MQFHMGCINDQSILFLKPFLWLFSGPSTFCSCWKVSGSWSVCWSKTHLDHFRAILWCSLHLESHWPLILRNNIYDVPVDEFYFHSRFHFLISKPASICWFVWVFLYCLLTFSEHQFLPGTWLRFVWVQRQTFIKATALINYGDIIA